MLRFEAKDGRRAVIVEVDDRVAYAYLLENDEIVGDVWLYNVAPTPETVDWRDRDAMPFLNPRSFCSDEPAPDLRQDVECRWVEDAVEICAGGIVVGRLAAGAKPGWSRMARMDGPLARTLRTA